MKKSVLWTRKGLVPTLFVLMLNIIIVPVGMALTIPVVAQASSMPTVYIDPPTINGTVIDQEFTVNISIRDSYQITAFGVGLTFNPSLLNCTGIFQGDFLKKVGTTMWSPGTIDNTAGVIEQSACLFQDPALYASGDGQLANVTFKVKALGVSDIHLRDVEVIKVGGEWIEFNILDIFTVTQVTPPETVVTVSRNCTSYLRTVHSGLSNHAFNELNKEISFNVTVPPLPGLVSGSSNVTIPKALLSLEPSHSWGVIIDSRLLNPSEITVTENTTHTFIYFLYDPGIHNVQITTRILISTISISLSSTVIALGSDVTISGDIDPVRQNVNVTILYKPSGETSWTTLGTNQTDSNSHYSYTWTPTEAGTYEIKASWDGDLDTFGAESGVQTLEVIPKELVVSLEAPITLKHGDSSLLNATVNNLGPDETNVTLQLFIDGNISDSVVIPFLQRDSFYTLSYNWTTPIVEAMYVMYNVTAYAPPLPGENVTDNNIATKFVDVRRVRELLVSLDAPVHLFPGDSSLINATVYNFGTNNETDVELQLLIDDDIKNSTVPPIPFLQVGSSYTLSYLWTPTVEGTYNVTAYAPPLPGENVTINNVATKLVKVGWLYIEPDSAPVGTQVTVIGGFPSPGIEVTVTFNDMLMGYTLTDENGEFTFIFNVPVSASGPQWIKASDGVTYRKTTFTVIDITPLDIEIDVGTIHFRGELAEFFMQIAFKGMAVNATSINATLYEPNNGVAYYQYPQNITFIATGFYKIAYGPILEEAPAGTYALVIEANYIPIDAPIEANGTSFKTFLLSPTLTGWNALLISINGTIGTIKTDVGLIEVKLDAINATLVSLEGDIATIETDIGVIMTDVANIGLRVTEINGSVVTIQTTLGTIEGKIVSIEGDIVTIETDIGTLETDVGTLGTDIGTLQGDVSSVKGSQEAFSTLLYIALALALIAAIGAIFTILIFLRRKPTP